MECNENNSRKRALNGERIGSSRTESNSVWKDLFAGGVAGTAGIAIGHPFDTVKVRLQQRQQLTGPKNLGVRPDGISPLYRGLYRGIGAPLATAAAVNACVFCVYGATSRLWDSYYHTSDTIEYSNASKTTILKNGVCGAITGFTTSLVLCPIEYVKIRLQTMQIQSGRSGGSANSSFRFAREILYSRHGIQGFYRGFIATVLRQTPSLAVYFPVYHILKESIPDFFIANKNKDENLWWSSALAGGLAGCLSWTMIYPIDAVKSRIQSLHLDVPAKQRSFLYIARIMNRNEGLARLMFSKGLAVTLLRAFPVNATIFYVYEYVNQHLRSINDFGLGHEEGLINTNANATTVKA